MIGTNWPAFFFFLADRLVGGWTDVNQSSPAICKRQSLPVQRWKGESGSLASGPAGDLLTPVITRAWATVVIMLVFPVLFHFFLFTLPLSLSLSLSLFLSFFLSFLSKVTKPSMKSTVVLEVICVRRPHLRHWNYDWFQKGGNTEAFLKFHYHNFLLAEH